MPRLENDPFLTELTKLFKKTQQTGSIFITMKRFVVSDVKKKGGSEKGEAACLVRVTGPGNVKLSTVLKSKDVVRFQREYSTLMKAHMDGLKKREKKSKSKTKKVTKE